jgi:linoleoyl-CoA desaturase
MSSPESPRCALKFQAPGGFAKAVNRSAHAALEGVPRFGDAAQGLRAAAFALAGFWAYGMLLAGAHAWQAIALIAVASFCAFMMIVQVGHDASHGALSSRPWVNRAALFLSFAILGVDGAQWRDRHIRLHHQVVNLPGTGIDADSVSLFRLAPDKAWRWWMRLQPLYAPLLYAAGHISLAWLEDFAGLVARRREGRREFTGPGALAQFAASKAVHVGLFLLVPWFVRRPSLECLGLGYLFASALIAVCFVLLVVGTHVSDLAAFPEPGADGQLPHDWATHQLVTSVDWSPENRLAVLLTGGANAHVAHHLFPGHNHRHMARLSRLIAETAAAHGLTHHVTSFSGMVAGQWRHLVAMSRRPLLGL